MAFTVKPFATLVAMSKEKLDEALLPLRVRAARAKADGEVVKLEEKMLNIETQINTACASKELDFHRIAALMDDYDLTERRLKQIQSLIADLFPAADQA